MSICSGIIYVHIQENDIQIFFQIFLIPHWVFSSLHAIKIHIENLYFEKNILNCLLRTIPTLPLDELLEGHRSVKCNYGCFLSASIYTAFWLSSFLTSCSNLSHQDILLAQFSFLTTLFVKTKWLYPHVLESG